MATVDIGLLNLYPKLIQGIFYDDYKKVKEVLAPEFHGEIVAENAAVYGAAQNVRFSNISEYISSLEKGFKEAMEKRLTNLKIEYLGDKQVKVTGEAEILHQVFMNREIRSIQKWEQTWQAASVFPEGYKFVSFTGTMTVKPKVEINTQKYGHSIWG